MGSYFEFMLEVSRHHSEALRRENLPDVERRRFETEAAESLSRQAALEAGDTVTFKEYLAGYFA